MAKIKRTDDQLPLSPPVLYILLAVADGPRHGYAIMKEVDRQTHGTIQLLPGSLYSTIKRMLEQGILTERGSLTSDGTDDPRRRYYEITPSGRTLARMEMERLSVIMDFAKSKRVTPSQA